MNFQEVCEKLGIEKYQERIFNSNSRGELIHLLDYYWVLETFPNAKTWFPALLDDIVAQSEQKSKRPESCFQHIKKIIVDLILEERDRRADKQPSSPE